MSDWDCGMIEMAKVAEMIEKLSPAEQEAVKELASFFMAQIGRAGPRVGITALVYAKAQCGIAVQMARSGKAKPS